MNIPPIPLVDAIVMRLVEESDVGTLTLSNVLLGRFRSANLSYWVDRGYAGRGLATQAVQHACRLADEAADLHRLEAGTLVRNKGVSAFSPKRGSR